jgi:hypothetical protein
LPAGFKKCLRFSTIFSSIYCIELERKRVAKL